MFLPNRAYLIENNQLYEKHGFGDITLSGDTTKVIEVDINKPFDIEIQCNLTTGYDIFLSYFPSAIKLVRSTSTSPQREKGFVGGPSNCHFTFELLIPTSTILLFTNVRPFSYEIGSTLKYEINMKKH
jgi:predicted secreted protein